MLMLMLFGVALAVVGDGVVVNDVATLFFFMLLTTA